MIKLVAIRPKAKAIQFTRFADAAKLGMRGLGGGRCGLGD